MLVTTGGWITQGHPAFRGSCFISPSNECFRCRRQSPSGNILQHFCCKCYPAQWQDANLNSLAPHTRQVPPASVDPEGRSAAPTVTLTSSMGASQQAVTWLRYYRLVLQTRNVSGRAPVELKGEKKLASLGGGQQQCGPAPFAGLGSPSQV